MKNLIKIIEIKIKKLNKHSSEKLKFKLNNIKQIYKELQIKNKT